MEAIAIYLLFWDSWLRQGRFVFYFFDFLQRLYIRRMARYKTKLDNNVLISVLFIDKINMLWSDWLKYSIEQFSLGSEV